MKPDPPEVARLRKILDGYDKGILTKGEVECMAGDKLMDDIRDSLRQGKDYGQFHAGCFSEAPPPEFYNVEIEFAVNGFWVRLKK